MIRIIDHRGTGKTTKLIQKAVQDKAILVVPTYSQLQYVRQMSIQLHCSADLGIVTFHEFLQKKTTYDRFPEKNYYIDNLDACLQSVGVLGYSNSIEE